jgi:hypothetical protein
MNNTINTTINKVNNKQDLYRLFDRTYISGIPQSKNTIIKVDCTKIPFMDVVDTIHNFTHVHRDIRLFFPPIKDDILIITMSWEQ